MIKVSQMKNVLPFTCDSFVIGEEYVCVVRTYKRNSRELIEEWLPIKITSSYGPRSEVAGAIKDSEGFDKTIVFTMTRQSRGIFTAEPEIKHSNANSVYERGISISYILVRSGIEWATIKYMRELANVIRCKMGVKDTDAFSVDKLDFEELESLREIIWQIERNRKQRIEYKGYSAGFDYVDDHGDDNCSFFDEYGELHRLVFGKLAATAFYVCFQKKVETILAMRKYRVVQVGDVAQIVDSETGEKIGNFENIHRAKAFIKNNLSQLETCGKITSKGLDK